MPYSWRVKRISPAHASNIGERIMYNGEQQGVYIHTYKHKIVNECTITFYSFHYYVVVIFITQCVSY